ncbi:MULTISPECIES: thiamine pyrophosphate-binding protein [unclassified Chelatococcus]|uniref:thiamine pyrophosphate-binding protein n=1 Tax=unclassified Chelatococcus TaxID=2638111 RepID=UPI001BCF6D4F|nr:MULTISPECIES: thiamine pyrophosphate-binding protein [unclassified Chelatococcus]MBS7701620.1 thiamine pyrophosphate-binding protein [Chelatococcus sp. YT9]MBX3559690.1 thiamine pyrophosphate-binding protein [Chelatococcus sp.]
MQGTERSRTGGQILVDQLIINGTDRVFCVPGESYLAVLDALYDRRDEIALVNARHEAGAANMAETYGKLTNLPGICFVTRGPGACHAAVGVHIAHQDSTPMILFIGQVDSGTMDREAFQEIDYRQMFGRVAKWVAQIDSAKRIPEYLARAFRVATSGRPGPVVLAIPEDVLAEKLVVPDARRVEPIAFGVSEEQLRAVGERLSAAQRPLAIVGGSGWTRQACDDFRHFAEANGLPVATSYRRQDVFDNRSPNFAGDLGTSGPVELIRRVKDADLLLVVGARLGEMTTQSYSLLPPSVRQVLVHVHPGADELGRVYQPDLALNLPPEAFASALRGAKWLDTKRLTAWRQAANADFLRANASPEGAGGLDMGQVLSALGDRLPEDFILTLDAGNHTHWPQRFLRYGRPNRQLGTTCGSMGYAVPAAVAASITYPDRLVIGCVGDGGFMMSGMELATAMQHGGKPIIILFNNSSYGTIRMHQEREYPGRVSGTDLVNPDFVGMGQVMGAYAERVSTTEAFFPAFERAVAAKRAALIEVVTEVEQITTRTTLTELRARKANNG